MKKLFKLKKWLTLADSARYLSAVLGDEASESDVLMLALDGHLKLSALFVNTVYARRLVPVEIEDIEYIEMPNLAGTGKLLWSKGGIIFQVEQRTFQISKDIEALDKDVCDIVLDGNARLDIEHAYQIKTGGPTVTDEIIDGEVLVENMKGELFQLLSHNSENKYFSKENIKKPWGHGDNFHPAWSLPDDSVLVVRTEALRAFEKSINDAPPAPTNRHNVSDRLVKLNQASTKFWANADRDDRATHPNNAKVVEWLVSQRFSETLADKAATILRPEWAPTGRKPEE